MTFLKAEKNLIFSKDDNILNLLKSSIESFGLSGNYHFRESNFFGEEGKPIPCRLYQTSLEEAKFNSGKKLILAEGTIPRKSILDLTLLFNPTSKRGDQEKRKISINNKTTLMEFRQQIAEIFPNIEDPKCLRCHLFVNGQKKVLKNETLTLQ